jgi:hypothetical protein
VDVENSGDCCVLTLGIQNERHTRKRVQTGCKGFSKKEEFEADQWVNFIEGRSRRPNVRQPKTHTVISESCSETAHNKPLVIGRCAGEKAKLFVDSGAEMNVVDSEFLEHLVAKQMPVRFTPVSSRIQCANGTQMTVTGHAVMSLQIGPVKAVQKFMVVKNLFPKVIVGIRSMKTMDIVIDPVADCLVVNGSVQIPFISCISPETVVEGIVDGELRNGEGPFEGARKSPQ